jgi:MFS family permease
MKPFSPFKLALLSSVGTALDYYDFVVYMVLSGLLASVFFKQADGAAGLLITLGIFASGYLARPLGGVIFGHFSDKYGRKKSFMVSLFLMACATAAIGCLPGNAWGAILLLCCRLAQGVAQGAEMPGAITFVAEHAPLRRRNFWVSLAIAGAGVGASLASGLMSLLTHFLSPAHLLAFGWRLPFWLGALLAFFAWGVRKKTQESLDFLALTHQEVFPLKRVLIHYKFKVIAGVGMISLPACMILLALFLPTYFSLYFAYPLTATLPILSLSFLLSSGCMVLGGALSDRFTPQKILSLGCILSLLLLYPLFLSLQGGGLWRVWVFLGVFEALIGLMAGAYPALLAALFPTSVRTTGLAVSYNIAYLLAGFFPLLNFWLLKQTEHAVISPLLLMACAGISLVSLRLIHKRIKLAFAF